MASHFKLAPTTHHASVECRRIVFIACCSVNVTPVDAWLLSISAYIFVAFYKREIRKCTNILSLFGSDVFLVGSSATADLLRSYHDARWPRLLFGGLEPQRNWRRRRPRRSTYNYFVPSSRNCSFGGRRPPRSPDRQPSSVRLSAALCHD